MSKIRDLSATVKKNTATIASAISRINGLTEKFASAGADAAKLSALEEDIKTLREALDALITANSQLAGDNIVVSVTPKTVLIGKSRGQKFKAKITGDSQKGGVGWMTESAMATIDQKGVLTLRPVEPPPGTTIIVKAISRTDHTKFDTAVATVA